MLHKFVSLLLLVTMMSLSACTTSNRTTGQSEVRQTPEDEQRQYDVNQPMESGATGRSPNEPMTGSPSIDQTSRDTTTESGAGSRP